MTRSLFLVALTLCLIVSVCFGSDDQPRVPTVDDLLTLKTRSEARKSLRMASGSPTPSAMATSNRMRS